MVDHKSPPPPPPPQRPPQHAPPSPPSNKDAPRHVEPEKKEELGVKKENYAPPKDFHLAEPGSKDYVAGQPTNEAELSKAEATRKAAQAPEK